MNLNIPSIAIKKCKAKYQQGNIDKVMYRLYKELEYIHKNNMEKDIETLYLWSKEAKKCDVLYMLGGASANSFLLYILGISKTNPLKAHYYCEQCGAIEFIEDPEFVEGYDLKDKACPVCCGDMIGDGHTLNHIHIFRKLPCGHQQPITIVVNPGYDFLSEATRLTRIYTGNKKWRIEKGQLSGDIVVQAKPLFHADSILKIEHVKNHDGINLFLNRYFGKTTSRFKNELTTKVTHGQRFINGNRLYFGNVKNVYDAIKLIGLQHGTWMNTDGEPMFDMEELAARIKGRSPDRYIVTKEWPFPIPLSDMPVFYDDFKFSDYKSEEELLSLYDAIHYGTIMDQLDCEDSCPDCDEDCLDCDEDCFNENTDIIDKEEAGIIYEPIEEWQDVDDESNQDVFAIDTENDKIHKLCGDVLIDEKHEFMLHMLCNARYLFPRGHALEMFNLLCEATFK